MSILLEHMAKGVCPELKAEHLDVVESTSRHKVGPDAITGDSAIRWEQLGEEVADFRLSTHSCAYSISADQGRMVVMLDVPVTARHTDGGQAIALTVLAKPMRERAVGSEISRQHLGVLPRRTSASTSETGRSRRGDG